MQYPDCCSQSTVKNGHSMTAKQKYKCKGCGRPFLLNLSGQISPRGPDKEVDG